MGYYKKTIDNYEGGDTKQLRDDLNNNVVSYISGGSNLIFNNAYFMGTQITSLFGNDDDNTKFGQVVKDYLMSKGDTTQLPENILKILKVIIQTLLLLLITYLRMLMKDYIEQKTLLVKHMLKYLKMYLERMN